MKSLSFALVFTILPICMDSSATDGKIVFYNRNYLGPDGITMPATSDTTGGIFRYSSGVPGTVGAGDGFIAGLFFASDTTFSNPIATTLFRPSSGTFSQVFATSQTVTVPGVPVGQTVQLSVAVWESGKTYLTSIMRGKQIFTSLPLGGPNPTPGEADVPIPGLTGFTGFSFFPANPYGWGQIIFYNRNYLGTDGNPMPATSPSNGGIFRPDGVSGMGTGFTAGLFLATDSQLENPIATTTFRPSTGSFSQVFSKSQTNYISGMPPGSTPELFISVWPTIACSPYVYNFGGQTFTSLPLGGRSPSGEDIPIPGITGFIGWNTGAFSAGGNPAFPTLPWGLMTGHFGSYAKAPSTWTQPNLYDGPLTQGAVLGLDAGKFAWTVDSGSVDYIGSFWKDADGGSGSIDMNGLTDGAISTQLKTVPGMGYRITFMLSGNPDLVDNPPVSQKRLRVSAGKNVAHFTYDVSVEGNTHDDMKWRSSEFIFVATNKLTKLQFASETGAGVSAGPVIDNIGVEYLGGPEVSLSRVNSANSLVVFSTCEYLPYQVQTRTSPNDPWIDLGNVIVGDGQLKTVPISVSSSEPLRMFRVKMTPPGY